MITAQDIEEWRKKQKAPKEIITYKKNALAAMAKAPPVSYKYGQKIAIKPELNIDTINTHAANISVIADAPAGVTITTMKDLQEADHPTIAAFFDKKWTTESDKNQLFFFNQAALTEIIIVSITKKTSSPINLQIAADADSSIGIFIVSQPDTAATIIIQRSTQGTYLVETTRVHAGKGSNITVISTQNTPQNVNNIQHRKAITEADAQVHWVDLCLGSAYTRSEIATQLDGEGSSTTNTVLYLATGKQRLDIYTAAIHAAPHTTSNSLTKGAVMGNAKALSRGLVKINANAAHSNGYEKQEALLLSNTAEADAIPYLEIDNPDVRCTHGSTIGQVDPEKVFYLMSRGLSKPDAHRKIIEGMFMPVLDKIGGRVQEQMQTIIAQALQ